VDAAVATQLLGVFLASPLWAGGEAEFWTSFEDEDGNHWTWAVAHLRVPRVSALELLADKFMLGERSGRRVEPSGTKARGRPPGRRYDADLVRLRDVEGLEWKEVRRRLVTVHGRDVSQTGALRKRYVKLKAPQPGGVKKG
jgi:hypothetical protein